MLALSRTGRRVSSGVILVRVKTANAYSLPDAVAPSASIRRAAAAIQTARFGKDRVVMAARA